MQSKTTFHHVIKNDRISLKRRPPTENGNRMLSITQSKNIEHQSNQIIEILAVVVIVVLSTLSSTQAKAAEAAVIRFVEDIIVELPSTSAEVYGHYLVSCNNREQHPISSWNNQTLWCVGKGKKDNCSLWRLNAATMACDSSAGAYMTYDEAAAIERSETLAAQHNKTRI